MAESCGCRNESDRVRGRRDGNHYVYPDNKSDSRQRHEAVVSMGWSRISFKYNELSSVRKTTGADEKTDDFAHESGDAGESQPKTDEKKLRRIP